MNNRGGTPLLGSPSRCSTTAQPLTRSVFATFNVIPSFAYCEATVDPSLCLLNTSAPATNRFRSEISNRRNGKVARLPAELRHQINVMLDDGVPYKIIIERLGDAGKHLNEDNLSNWRLGGFQDYQKAQLINERARAQTQAAADLLREGAQVDTAQLKRVCGEIAVLHFLDTLLEHGDQIANEPLKKNPAKLITLINACCKMSDASIAAERHQWLLKDSQPKPVATTMGGRPSVRRPHLTNSQLSTLSSQLRRVQPNPTEHEKCVPAPKFPVNPLNKQ